ncbi:uncharacterized protein IL334_003576 [Kwoniella shivajii]|uniref:Ricin B lectin domain-containing protein n=1 Tax=Kwoniella shivajii TaxID=564305 RepID=A0ABZ1CZ48_9TREE|nr:hypothetical protein IL334_003576 [Kwoniella shivajii]
MVNKILLTVQTLLVSVSATDFYKIHPKSHEDLCITVKNGKLEKGAELEIERCLPNDSVDVKTQQFAGQQDDNIFIMFSKDATELNIDNGGGTARGNGLTLESAGNHPIPPPSSYWSYDEERLYSVDYNQKRQLCLDVIENGGSVDVGSKNLQIWDCIDGASNQLWTFT